MCNAAEVRCYKVVGMVVVVVTTRNGEREATSMEFVLAGLLLWLWAPARPSTERGAQWLSKLKHLAYLIKESPRWVDPRCGLKIAGLFVLSSYLIHSRLNKYMV